MSFAGYQTSTNFKLASLGMRGAQERALFVSDDNIGTYGSCTIIYMKTSVVVLNKYRLLYTTNVPVYGMYVCLLQMVIPLLLSRQQGEELDQNTYGVRNRRQKVYASLEVCKFWLGYLISTATTVVCTY